MSLLDMMTDAAGQDPRTGEPCYPRRFLAAPERGARAARPLGWAGGVRTVDEDLLDRLGRAMFARDEPGAELARAMDRPHGDPERVTHARLHRALADGVTADDPVALRRFLAVVEPTPEWLDRERVERGARVMRRMGRTAGDVLLALSLIGGYRYGGPADFLVATGGLSGSTAMRRLGETETWTRAVISPGGLDRDGEGFRLTVHVRAMHALLNRRFETNGRWDTARWGLPINQTDQAATLSLFSSTALLGGRLLGWMVSAEESRSVMHLWRYVGWLLGVDPEWAYDTEREQHAFLHHVVRVQDDVTPAGPALARALVEGQRTQARGPLAGLRGRWRRWRLLGVLRWFVGREGMRDLELPAMPPWVVPGLVARNLLHSMLVARTRTGRRWLERRGDRYLEGELALRFDRARPGVGDLPAA